MCHILVKSDGVGSHIKGLGASVGSEIFIEKEVALFELSWARHARHIDAEGRQICTGSPDSKLTITSSDLGGQR